ncbi:unnamed protein product [Musa banksii]
MVQDWRRREIASSALLFSMDENSGGVSCGGLPPSPCGKQGCSSSSSSRGIEEEISQEQRRDFLLLPLLIERNRDCCRNKDCNRKQTQELGCWRSAKGGENSIAIDTAILLRLLIGEKGPGGESCDFLLQPFALRRTEEKRLLPSVLLQAKEIGRGRFSSSSSCLTASGNREGGNYVLLSSDSARWNRGEFLWGPATACSLSTLLLPLLIECVALPTLHKHGSNGLVAPPLSSFWQDVPSTNQYRNKSRSRSRPNVLISSDHRPWTSLFKAPVGNSDLSLDFFTPEVQADKKITVYEIADSAELIETWSMVIVGYVVELKTSYFPLSSFIKTRWGTSAFDLHMLENDFFVCKLYIL